MRDADIVRKQKNLDLRAGAEVAADRRRARRQAAQRRSRGPREGGQALMQAATPRKEGGAVPSKRGAAARQGASRPSREGRMPTTDDEIQEKYLERAIRELNQLTHRPPGVLALPARQPDAGARLRAIRRPT